MSALFLHVGWCEDIAHLKIRSRSLFGTSPATSRIEEPRELPVLSERETYNSCAVDSTQFRVQEEPVRAQKIDSEQEQ
jgi:hypothetical protein